MRILSFPSLSTFNLPTLLNQEDHHKMRSRMLHQPLDKLATLAMSRSSFLAAHLLPSGKQYASLVVSAAIFQPNTHKVLLLKRSPAEKLFAHHWEIPGGKVDDTDKTIGDALKREVREETGLTIKESNVTFAEEGFQWVRSENVTDDPDPEMALELNFILEGEEFPEQVKLDPEEHLESLWTDEMDLMGLKMTPEMRNVVEHGFTVLRVRRREAWTRMIAELVILPKEKN